MYLDTIEMHDSRI